MEGEEAEKTVRILLKFSILVMMVVLTRGRRVKMKDNFEGRADRIY